MLKNKQIRVTDRINAARRRSAARQSVHDQQRGELLVNSDSLFALAQLIPAVVVLICVTTMVDPLLMLMTHSSSQYTTGS